MKASIGNILIGAIALIVILNMTMFVVDQRQTVVVFQLGEIVSVKTKPGLHFKVPLAQNVRYFDSRILTLDSPEPKSTITSEKKNLMVSYFVKWRIADPRQYYKKTSGDERLAQNRLMQSVNDSIADEFGKRTIHDVLSGERDKIMELLRTRADKDANEFGMQVLDVRLKRVDFPEQISDSVYRRMEAERKRVANELRATGNAESEKIRADADRQREVTLANAYRDAQRIKGEGDAKASVLYAAAFGRNSEFYSFYRSMEAYKQSFKNKSDVMVLDPSSAFFKHLKGSYRQAK
ncbi:MAG: protease modulator HflC [Candidatus Nitrotoga sp.]